LLDISAVVKPELLAKYELKPNDAILYEKEDIFEDLIKDYEIEYIAGGATQNSCRVAQWILEKPNSVAYFGCVGTDENSNILKKVASEAGVKVLYQGSTKTTETGRCAVLITGLNRSLVTKLDAANHFTVDHLEISENWEVVDKAKVFYSAGFFITVSPDPMLKVAKHAAEHADKKFCVNLSAPFICQFFKDPLNQVLEYADVVVGNETEAETYAEHNFDKGSYTDRKDIAKKIAALPYKGKGKSRIVIVTQGCDPCILVENGEVSEHPVTKLSTDQIVDTNGAGDAFVGGFLAQLAKGKSVKEAIRCGVWAATEIIQVSGCTCDPAKTY
jgi:adenosine kinase